MLVVLQIQNPITSPGTGSFTSHSIEILVICAIGFLLGWFLHHLIHCTRHLAKVAELERNLRSARTRINDLDGDLTSCNSAIVNIKGENAALSTKISKLEKAAKDRDTVSDGASLEPDIAMTTGVNLGSISEAGDASLDDAIVSGLASEIAGSGGSGFDAAGAKAVFGKKIKEDDLKIVEGIGPKTEGLLNNSSIHTWRQLGNTSVPQLQNILDKAGDRFQLLNPSTWPKQSRMASDGEWIKLREYQDYLVGGVEPVDVAPPSDKESTKVQYIMGKRIKQDDLTIVEGIGPKIQELLQKSGITTWTALSGASVDHLEDILNNAGDRYRIHKPGTWPKQAGMAATGKWDDLKDYQDYLDGGVNPS